MDSDLRLISEPYKLTRLHYTKEDAAFLLRLSVREIGLLVDAGLLVEHRKNGPGTKPVRITRDSIWEYHIRGIIIK